MRAVRQACGSTFEEVEEFLTSEIFPVASKSLFDIAPFLSIIISRSSNKLHTTSNSHRTIGDNTGVEAYGFGGIRRGQTLQFDGGGQGTFSPTVDCRGCEWRIQHASIVPGVSPREGVRCGPRVEGRRAQNDGSLGVRQEAEERESVCLFWHVSHRPREQRGKDTNPLLERSSGCSRDVAWSE